MNRLLLIILFACSLSACHKDDIVWNPSVYVGGFIGTAASNAWYTGFGNVRATLFWKDGNQISLTGGGVACNIVVYGKDAYVSTSGGYWKNSQIKELKQGTLFYVAVTDSGVYMAGNVNFGDTLHATIWKNGQETLLIDRLQSNGDQYNSSTITGITSSGNDVYVAGEIDDFSSNSTILGYWRNEHWVALYDGSGNVYDISVHGNDVYVSGYLGDNFAFSSNVATYWKNEEMVALTDSSLNGAAKAIAVSDNNDVYVAGFIMPLFPTPKTFYTTAGYWKNGQWVALTDGTSNAVANDIALYGNDVYVAGHITNGSNTIAGYWKNGHWNAIADGEATSIVVQ